MKRFDSASGLQRHDRDDEQLLRAEAAPVIAMSATGRGFESRPERTRSGSSVGRAVSGLHPHDRGSPLDVRTAGRRGAVISHPGSTGGREPPPGDRRVSHPPVFTTRPRCPPIRLRAGGGRLSGRAPDRSSVGRSRVRRPPATAPPRRSSALPLFDPTTAASSHERRFACTT